MSNWGTNIKLKTKNKNKMKTFKLLCEVTFSQELISKKGIAYLRVEVKPIVITIDGASVSQEQIGLTINKPISVYKLPAHVGNVTKCSIGNIIILNVAEHIDGVTSYIKDNVEVFHSENTLNVEFVELLSDIELFEMLENGVILEAKYNFLEKKLERLRKIQMYK